MHGFMNVQECPRQGKEKRGDDPRWVRAISGGVSRSSLESRVLEVLASRPACPWNHLVAEVAEHLRRCDRPGALASLDEGFWGGWIWPALARKELWRLDGILLAID